MGRGDETTGCIVDKIVVLGVGATIRIRLHHTLNIRDTYGMLMPNRNTLRRDGKTFIKHGDRY